MMTETKFNPVDFGFRWVADGTEMGWYQFDYKSACESAKKARDAYAKDMKKKGYTVKKRSSKNNLISKGGIGSGRPHIELLVPIYRVIVFI